MRYAIGSHDGHSFQQLAMEDDLTAEDTQQMDLIRRIRCGKSQLRDGISSS